MRRSRSQYVLMAGAALTAVGLLLGVALWRPARPREGAFARPPRELQWQRDLLLPARKALQAPGFRVCTTRFGGRHGPWPAFESLQLDQPLRELRASGHGGIAVTVPWRRFQPQATPMQHDEREFGKLVELAGKAGDHGLHVLVQVTCPDQDSDAQALAALVGELGTRLRGHPQVLAILLGEPDAGIRSPADWFAEHVARCAEAAAASAGPPFGAAVPAGHELPDPPAAPLDLVTVGAASGLGETLARADAARRWTGGAPVLVDRLVLPAADDSGATADWLRALDQRAYGWVRIDPARDEEVLVENASFADGLLGWQVERGAPSVRQDPLRRQLHVVLPLGARIAQAVTAGTARQLELLARAPGAAARLQIGEDAGGLQIDVDMSWQRISVELPAPPQALRFAADVAALELDEIRLAAHAPAASGPPAPELIAHQLGVLQRTGQRDAEPTTVWSESALAERARTRGEAGLDGTTRMAIPLLLPWHESELEIDLEPAAAAPVGPCEVSLDGLPIATIPLQSRRSRHLLALDASLEPGLRMLRIQTRGPGDLIVLHGLRVLMPGPRDERRWVLHVEPAQERALRIEARVETAGGTPAAGTEIAVRFGSSTARSRTDADGRAEVALALPADATPGPLFVELTAAQQRLVDVRRLP